MTNTRLIFTKGQLRLVPDWPDKKKYVIDWKMPNSPALIIDELYQEDCKQAIANAIPFKEKDDEQKVIFYMSPVSDADSLVWQPEENKPYEVPNGITIRIEKQFRHKELKYRTTEEDGWLPLMSDKQLDKEFLEFRTVAFLVHEKKEETQEELVTSLIREWMKPVTRKGECMERVLSHFRIERIKE